jgi:hypothetical protein
MCFRSHLVHQAVTRSTCRNGRSRRVKNGPMQDDAQAALDQLEARLEMSDRVQLVGWLAGPLERSFAIRIGEILDEVDRWTKRSRSNRGPGPMKSLPKVDRIRVERAVERFFSSMTSAGGAIAELDFDDFEHADDVALIPYEQRLLIGRLLIGETDEQLMTAALVHDLRSPDDLRLAERLMSDRLSDARSPAVLEGLLVTAFGAFEDLMLPLVRIALMTTESFAVDGDDEFAHLKRLVSASVNCIRGGPTSWKSTWMSEMEFDLSTLVDDWDALIEAHLRRNALVHHGGRVDGAYLKRLPGSLQAPALGEALVVDGPYLADSVQALRAVGSGLATLLPSLVADDSEHLPLSRPNDLVCDLLRGHRYADAVCVAKAFRANEPDPDSRATLYINELMARRNSGTPMIEIRSAVEALEKPSDDLGWDIAVAALVRNEDALLTALRAARRAGVDLSLYRRWPLLANASPRVVTILSRRKS